jgi:hypothetical protein
MGHFERRVVNPCRDLNFQKNNGWTIPAKIYFSRSGGTEAQLKTAMPPTIMAKFEEELDPQESVLSE